KDRKGCRFWFASDDFSLRKSQAEITGSDTLFSPDFKNSERHRYVPQRLINLVQKNFFQHEICAGISAKMQIKLSAFVGD
ncbi:MAG: hypothetical protein ACK5V0_01675, partial [Alphaproteobacteria bacterium]